METIERARGRGDANDGTTSRREARGDANERSETTASEDAMETGGRDEDANAMGKDDGNGKGVVHGMSISAAIAARPTMDAELTMKAVVSHALAKNAHLRKVAGESAGKDPKKGKPKKEKPPNQSRENRRVRQFRSASEISQEELSSCFHLPSEAACRKLGVGLTVLKRQCRKYGIARWPFRKMKSLDRLITNVQAGISPGDQNKLLVKSVEELEDQKRRMEECAVLDLDDTTKKLQQAYSKANHKARRNRSDASRIRAVAAAQAVRELQARARGGYGEEPNGASGMLLDLAHELAMGSENGDDDDEGSSDDGFDNEDEDVTTDADAGASTPASRGAKSASGATTPDRITPTNNSDGTPLQSAPQLLSNTPSDAGAAIPNIVKDEGGDGGAPSSNVMVQKGSANANEFVKVDKVLTAVRGTWSPARPARKTDDLDGAEAFLSPASRRKGGKLGEALSDDEYEKITMSVQKRRGRPPGPSKRGRKRKGAEVEDDPLASLAAAALDSMGTTKKTAVAATRGRPKSVSAADKTSRLTASGKITAASKYRMDVPAVTEDHPAYGLTAGFTAKGARSGVASRLSQVERSDLEHLLRERLKKGKMALCDAFGIAPAEYDQHFDPKLQATSLTNAVEKLAVKSAAKMRRLEA
jgi:hypothetical protein